MAFATNWYKKTGIRRQVFVIFSIITGIIMTISLIGIMGINRVAEDINGLYYDRLLPAVEMANLTEKLYENRLLLEEYLYLDDSLMRKKILEKIERNHKSIDSLASKYAESHLVEEENRFLITYRKEIFKYKQLESEIVKLFATDAESAKTLFSTEASEEFKKIIEPIHRIADVQLKIGEELRKESIKEANSIRFALYLAMGIVILAIIITGAWLGFVYMMQ
jgi:hypothetical protein